MRLLVTTAALLLSGCLIDPPEIEGKACSIDRGCPPGFTCVAEADAVEGICHSRLDEPMCEGDVPACELTLGVCALSQKQCVAGEWAVCAASSYPSTYEAVESTCFDSLDNDCDGRLDVSAVVKTNDRAVLDYDVRRTQDGGYVVAAREAVSGGTRVVTYALDADLVELSAPTVLSTTTQVTFGPVVHARLGRTGVTWAERSVADGGEAVWFALVDNLGALTSLDGGLELPRRALAEGDVASTPRTAWLGVDATHLTVWTDAQRQLLTVFLDNDGRPLASGVRPLPHTLWLGDAYEAAVSERLETSDGKGFGIAWTAKDGGQDWIGLRLVTATNLAVDGIKENIPYPARNIRIGRTHRYGAGSNISWYSWVEDRPANDPVRIRTSYGADTLAEFVGTSGPVTKMELVVTEDDKLIVAWSDGGTTRVASSPSLKGSDAVNFGASSALEGGMPAVAAALGNYAVFASRDAGAVFAERRCGP